jgi:hypothetical protein
VNEMWIRGLCWNEGEERERESNGAAFSNPRDRGLHLFPRALNI